jgi:hypothetical protein
MHGEYKKIINRYHPNTKVSPSTGLIPEEKNR